MFVVIVHKQKRDEGVLVRLLNKLVLLTCMLVGANTLAADSATPSKSQWQAAPDLPIKLQEVYPAVFMDRIFIGGGFTTTDSDSFYGLGPTRSVFILNPAEQFWEKAPDLPESRHHLGMASNIHYIYAIGGFTGPKSDAWQPQRSVYRLDSRKRSWHRAPTLPIPLAESVYANVGKNIHIIGGKTRERGETQNIDTNAHYVLINNAYWRKAKPAPTARASAAGAVIGNDIYVIGGRTGGENRQNLNTVEVYDAQTETWQTRAPLPIAAAGLAAAVIDGKIIVSGGEAFAESGKREDGKVYSTVFQYDPNIDEWQELEALPSPRHGHGKVSLNGEVYVLGGAAKIGPQETLSSTLIYQPAQD
jgi:hypothetical protein